MANSMQRAFDISIENPSMSLRDALEAAGLSFFKENGILVDSYGVPYQNLVSALCRHIF